MNGLALQKQGETEGTGLNLPGAPQAPNDRFLKLKEVQQMFGVSRSTVWRWHAERGLKVVAIGAVTRIRESDLQAFLKRHETNGAGVGTGQMNPGAGEAREPTE